jgi:purine-nucleoside phosphorylase
MMRSSLQQVEAAARAIRGHWSAQPRVGMILGSGLGELTRQIDVEAEIDYESIPKFPRATAPGHRGRFACGALAGVPIVAMDGRFHAYEGYSPAEVAFGVRVMRALGIELLILSNACGGMNPNFRAGDVMIVEDHVNLTFGNPLVGPHDARGGTNYPDMSRPYDRELIERALAVARRNNFAAHRGVYVGVTGPNYETRAEYRLFRRIGGDAVGMSTVFEVIVAAQCSLRVLALAVVTNVCFPERLQPTDEGEVLRIAAAAEPKVRAIVLGIVEHEAAGNCPAPAEPPVKAARPPRRRS